MLQIRKTAYTHSLLALLFTPLVTGCGSSGSTTVTSTPTAGPAGKTIQGAVSGATVWADNVAAGTQFSLDPAEQTTQTKTAADGTFTLPITPSYKYTIVSQGGTDTVTGQPATTLVAPGGAKTVSLLTTLVTLDTTGTLANTLEALLPAGASFDTDFTQAGALSPAAMVFVTSIITATTSFNTAIQNAATKSGATLSAQQLNDLYLTPYSQIAKSFSTLSPGTLSNTASLATNLQSALTNAITVVGTNNTNIQGLSAASMATTIANNSVAVAANVVGNATGNTQLQGVTATNVQSTGVTASSTSTLTEAAVLSGSNAQTLTTAISQAVTAITAGISAASTPGSYAPPAIPVANNPTVIAYSLVINSSGGSYLVNTFTITFSDDMVATQTGDPTFAHSVLNPANYQFSQAGCAPKSYASKVVTFTCSTLKPGSFQIVVAKSTPAAGVWASSTSLGLLVNNTKSFELPLITGSSGGNSFNLF